MASMAELARGITEVYPTKAEKDAANKQLRGRLKLYPTLRDRQILADRRAVIGTRSRPNL